MKKIYNKSKVLKISNMFEFILASVVIGVVILGTIDSLRIIWGYYIVDFKNPVQYEQLNNILAHILLLVIAIELVIMLTLHKAEAILEVLLYAIARKLILLPKKDSMDDFFLGVISIAILFAIKKFLMNREIIVEKEEVEHG
ncbi:phosphate-starvation-inducible PsiE family protein [Paraclostridium dentum]|uniref:phosphate-starvation-inducible PsiE family protein n=1 Tax=Paraclostridium dentum TaxID=2662455 RepID=UPI001473FDBB|nr:phosphate-starvation-inducible PsiE family protein [Paraclostridium dentum]